MSGSIEQFVIRPRKTGWFALLIVCIWFIKNGVGVIADYGDWGYGAWVIGMACLIGVIPMAMLYESIFGGLVIDNRGIKLSPYGLIEWRDIESIKVGTTHGYSHLTLEIAEERRKKFSAFWLHLQGIVLRRYGQKPHNDVRLPLSSIYDHQKDKYEGYVDLINRHKEIIGNMDVNAIPGRWSWRFW